MYWERGDVLKAGPCVGRTLQLRPDFAEAHLLAGNVLLKVGQQQRAKIEYEEYLRLAPKGDYAAEARRLINQLEKIDRYARLWRAVNRAHASTPEACVPIPN